jgi:hypothetical protein
MRLEGSVDTVIDQAKTQLHELRKEAQEVSEQALGRVERSWDDTLTNIGKLPVRGWSSELFVPSHLSFRRGIARSGALDLNTVPVT